MGEKKLTDPSGKSISQPTWKKVSSCAGDQKNKHVQSYHKM